MKEEKMFSKRKHTFHAQKSPPLRLVFHAPDGSAVLAKEVRIKTKMESCHQSWAPATGVLKRTKKMLGR